MEQWDVAAHVRERLGMEVQAVSLVRARAPTEVTPYVWAVMTEHGHFWLVEGAGRVELFRALPTRAGAAGGADCGSAAEAARRFLELHPDVQGAESPPIRSAPPEDGLSFACQSCGVWVTRRRRTEQSNRHLCKRCRHAERERLRYHDDPQYRARRLAYSSARYRQARQPGDPQSTSASDGARS
jgi:predicted RNA-binding Zn-ribbon protein involved in translation (DUF1610 family)